MSVRHVLIVEYADDWPHSVWGPFDTVREAQVFARQYRSENKIPGAINVEPTSEENEAWTEAGWAFAITQLNTPIEETA